MDIYTYIYIKYIVQIFLMSTGEIERAPHVHTHACTPFLPNLFSNFPSDGGGTWHQGFDDLLEELRGKDHAYQ